MTFSNPYIAIVFIIGFIGIIVGFGISTMLPNLKEQWKSLNNAYAFKRAYKQFNLRPDEIKLFQFSNTEFVICMGDLYDPETKILYCCREMCICQYCKKSTDTFTKIRLFYKIKKLKDKIDKL